MKDFNRYIIPLICFLLCFTVFINISIQENSENFVLYNSSDTVFTIQYPSNWHVSERLNVNHTNDSNLPVEFITPFEGPSDLIQEIFIVNTIPLPANTTLDNYVNKALNQFNTTYTDFKLISLNSTTQDNIYNATNLTYSYLAGTAKMNIKLVMSHYIILFKENIYVLTFGTQPNKYYDFLPTIQQMTASFRIK